MIARGSGSWQVVLADLALILFVVTLSALVGAPPDTQATDAPLADQSQPEVQTGPSQALFRLSPLGPSLEEWLRAQARDERLTLTIFAEHTAGQRGAVWQQADALAREAERSGFAVRVMITKGESDDLYASLAYDRADGSRQ